MSDKDKNKRVAANFTEYGIGGYDFSGDFVWSDFLPQLNWPNAGKIYEEMSKNDPTVGAIIYMAKQLVRKSKWSVKVGGSSPRDKEAAEFLETCMNDMEHSWNEFIGEALSMMVYGWSYHEVVYKMRLGRDKDCRFNSKFTDGKIGWRKLAGRSQRTCYGWEINQVTGEIEGLIQQSAPDYALRTIPASKAIHFKTENDYGNPFGRSLLRNAYRPWFFKKRIEEIEGIGVERDLAGLPVLIPPEDVDIWDNEDKDMVRLKSMAEQLVKNIRRDQSEGLAIPNGWELKLLSTGSRRQFDTNAILNRYDQRIAITLLADIVMLGADKVGSFALADVKKSLLSASLETLLGIMADAINRQEIPRLMALNGYDDLEEYPQVTADEVEIPSIEELARLIQAMNSAGMDVQDPKLEVFLRKVASIPENDPEVLDIKEELYKKGLEQKVEQVNTPDPVPNSGESNTDPDDPSAEGGDIDGQVTTGDDQ